MAGDGNLLATLKNRPGICEIATNKSRVIWVCENKTDKLCHLAVSLDFRNIYDVKNPNDDI